MPRHALPTLDVHRQSHLAGFTTCARRTRHALAAGDDLAFGWVGFTGDLGTAWHAYARRYLETLYRYGEIQMPTQEAVELLYETLRMLEFALPHEAIDDLVHMALGFCAVQWDPTTILALERRLEMPVECEDGQTRILKGQPDVVLADPPDAIVLIDYKSGRGKPKGPRQDPPAGEVIENRRWLSDRGHFQGDVYSMLALNEWPAAEVVRFREIHLRSGQIRQASLSREHLEHPRRRLSLTMELFDRALAEGWDSSLWTPRPGSHCGKKCPVSRSCRIPREMRGAGAIATPAQANAAAARWAKIRGEGDTLREQLKAWDDDPEHPHALANEHEEVRWGPDGDARLSKGGGRGFDIWPRANGNGGA